MRIHHESTHSVIFEKGPVVGLPLTEGSLGIGQLCREGLQVFGSLLGPAASLSEGQGHGEENDGDGPKEDLLNGWLGDPLQIRRKSRLEPIIETSAAPNSSTV